jgi:hypothetical protein
MTDERDEVNDAIAEHVRQVRERLAEGRTEIDRQRASIDWLKNAGLEDDEAAA